MITNTIIYLYVKQHSITGMKYFGKTIKINPFKYKGSGTYWLRHIKKHGMRFVKTLQVWGFDDQQLCTEFALKFSLENNITKSKGWANLIDENGLNTFANTALVKDNKTQNNFRISINDVNFKYYDGHTKGKSYAINSLTGNSEYVLKKDPRWITGELIGNQKNKNVYNDGYREFMLYKDDILIKEKNLKKGSMRKDTNLRRWYNDGINTFFIPENNKNCKNLIKGRKLNKLHPPDME